MLPSVDEKIQITYSYWDGSGHRRAINVTKGTTVGQFLEACRKSLVDSFSELRSLSSENLLYVKEDLIIPQSYSFYDLIVTKARGKSGPLFHFDVHDDVRLSVDASVEKDEVRSLIERHIPNNVSSPHHAKPAISLLFSLFL